MRYFFTLLALTGQAQASDYLGVRFDPVSYPLCAQYGCRILDQRTLPVGSAVTVQLKKVDAKFHLSLSQHRSVMGMEMILPGNYRAQSSAAHFLRSVSNNAAQQQFETSRYDRCFRAVQGPPNLRQATLLAEYHYRVTCIQKTYRGRQYHGMRISFDI